jgi:predicted secreted protein
MRKPVLGLISVMLGAVALTGLAIDQAAAARKQRFSVGSSWVFQIEGNPSTGYIWRLNQASCENLAIVKVEDLGYGESAAATDQKKRVGAPAPYRFRITGLAPGFTKLHFEYVRPWEDKPAKTEDAWVRIEE